MGRMVWGFKKISGEAKEVFSHTRAEVSDGSKIRLWHDVWCGDQALKIAFPNLFSIAHLKEAAMSDYLELSSAFHQWNVNSLRVAHN